jgi:altronate hydrolase
MFGAETILMNRAQNEAVFNKIAGLINDFKTYYKNHGQVIYENPSPGNKKGGITTLEEKSLGCIRKAGRSKVMDVIRVGDTLKAKGLNLLSAPGNDLVSTTSLGIAGCHMVLFTTGRGTPFGGFIPTVKISTNSELAEKKKHWIDFDAGKLCGATNMSALSEEFIQYIIRVVNGEKTNNEKNGAREIALFKSGVTL